MAQQPLKQRLEYSLQPFILATYSAPIRFFSFQKMYILTRIINLHSNYNLAAWKHGCWKKGFTEQLKNIYIVIVNFKKIISGILIVYIHHSVEKRI